MDSEAQTRGNYFLNKYFQAWMFMFQAGRRSEADFFKDRFFDELSITELKDE